MICTKLYYQLSYIYWFKKGAVPVIYIQSCGDSAAVAATRPRLAIEEAIPALRWPLHNNKSIPEDSVHPLSSLLSLRATANIISLEARYRPSPRTSPYL